MVTGATNGPDTERGMHKRKGCELIPLRTPGLWDSNSVLRQ